MRFFYWRALGAKVPFNFNTSYKITIHDAAVISIGEGTTLSEDVTLSGHLVRGDKILVAEVKIGKSVFVGRNTYIGPRTRIGKNAWIGMGNMVAGDVIQENQKIKSFEWSQGNPLKNQKPS
jgi:acetyltransferase-like isoleucine patch superfamily enzyme